MNIPLAEQLRPKQLSEVVGQEHLTSKNGWITRVVEAKTPLSILLWGPPGCGKTTLARLYAKAFDARFIPLSAVSCGTADLKKIIKETQDYPLLYRQPIIFVDEIHRFNKAQQDTFLPFLEDGTLILIGATTENPSFELNSALLSRLRVLTLNALDSSALSTLLTRFEEQNPQLSFTETGRGQLIDLAAGDGRHLINMLENLKLLQTGEPIDAEVVQQRAQKRAALYDKGGEQHYNLISALHKAVRGSDPDASLYWFARMLEGGENPEFIARRLVRMASEDVGLADPQALQIALAAAEAFRQLGSPEGELALAEAVIYLALAPKSNALYVAYGKARAAAKESAHLSPPHIILNSPTKLMNELGYGKGYIYDHDTAEGFSGQEYFPDEMQRHSFYDPVERGFEREMAKRLKYFSALRSKKTC
jgi:putative ATPase